MTTNTPYLPFASIEEAIHHCQSPIPAELKDLVTRLTFTSPSILIDLYLANPHALTSLPVSEHGLILLFICQLLLNAGMDAYIEDGRLDHYLMTSYTLVNSVDPAILQCAPIASKNLAESLVSASRTLISPTPIVNALVTLTCKFTLPSAINPVLPITLQFCLKSIQLQSALPLLDHGKESLQHPVSVEDVLLFHYYAGFILLGLKQFQRAMDYFYFNLCVPTRGAVSKIQIASFQKLILTSLIKSGEDAGIPKSETTNAAVTYSRGASEPYIEFARSYKSALAQNQYTAPHAIAERYAELFELHGHLGLVRQALAELPAHFIMRLPNVYSTVHIDRIVQSLNPVVTVDQIQCLVVQLVAQGRLCARMDQGYIEFISKNSNESVTSSITHKIRNAVHESRRILEVDAAFAQKLAGNTRKILSSSLLQPASPMYVSADEDMDLS